MISATVMTGGNGTERVYYTPWFPRRADNALFAYELLYEDAADMIAVTIYHKDAEDAGSAPGSPSGGFAQLGSTGVFQASVSGLKEMIRFQVTVRDVTGGKTFAFRFLPPTWLATAKT
jgi:hypothetical protein